MSRREINPASGDPISALSQRHRNTLRAAAERYARAAVEDSWKGGGNPIDAPVKEAEFKLAAALLEQAICNACP